MIIRDLPDGWKLVLDDDGEREVMRFKLPPGGMTITEWERLREHLLKLATEKEIGPS